MKCSIIRLFSKLQEYQLRKLKPNYKELKNWYSRTPHNRSRFFRCLLSVVASWKSKTVCFPRLTHVLVDLVASWKVVKITVFITSLFIWPNSFLTKAGSRGGRLWGVLLYRLVKWTGSKWIQWNLSNLNPGKFELGLIYIYAWEC